MVGLTRKLFTKNECQVKYKACQKVDSLVKRLLFLAGGLNLDNKLFKSCYKNLFSWKGKNKNEKEECVRHGQFAGLGSGGSFALELRQQIRDVHDLGAGGAS
jgi:hypothetical protein